MKFILLIILINIGLSSCGDNNEYDAAGIFEVDEIIVSSQSSGELEEFNVDEGKKVTKGEILGVIDTLQLFLKKKELEAQIKAIDSKKPNINIQLATQKKQLEKLEQEKLRIDNLVKASAIPTKQLDDIKSEIEILKNQINAQKSSLDISYRSISKELLPLEIQIKQIEYQIKKSLIINPINGIILEKYSNKNEVVSFGKPLYLVADISELILRIYVTGEQLPTLKLNQKVLVSQDISSSDELDNGEIIWISSKAEFTPKTIQTKKERDNKVYAVKVKVKNVNEKYKIGMYGEVKFL